MQNFTTLSDKDAALVNGGLLNFGTTIIQKQAASTSTSTGLFTAASAGAASTGTNNANIGQSGLSVLSLNTGAIYS
jgi:hypothetical protein